MIADGENLARLLPQKPPMVLIHELLSCDAEKTVSRFRVSADSVLFDEGFLSEAGLIENIAQTAAAGAGFGFRQQGQPAPIGYIAVVKNLAIAQLPPAGTEITTEVVVVNQVMEFTIVRGKVSSGAVTFAECEMRIFIKPQGL
jgi:predicted hotdog family 3-hydroxylacyl-ACP dehydratase